MEKVTAMPHFNVFILEDNDKKYSKISKLITSIPFVGLRIFRASNLRDAETILHDRIWHLYVLDISMDVSKKTNLGQSLHNARGGVSFANMIYIHALEAPTVAVTAFDAFPLLGGPKSTSVVELSHVERKLTENLGKHFLGSARYGQSGWESKLKSLIGDIGK